MNDKNYGEAYLDKELQTLERKGSKFKKATPEKLGITEVDAKDVWNTIGEVVFNILLAIMTLAILGLFELFKPDWDWSIYTEAAFWIGYAITQSASWFSRIWVYVVRIKHHTAHDQTYLLQETKLQKYVDIDFENPFIAEEAEIENTKRKKRAWLNKQKRKLIKYTNKYQIINILETVNHIEDFDFKNERFKLESAREIVKHKKVYEWLLSLVFMSFKQRTKRWEKKQIKINRKLNRILETITEKWCEVNLDTVKVKYHKVSKTILCSGYMPSRSDDNTPDYKSNSAKVFFEATLPSFVFMSFLMFLIVPLQGDLAKDASAWFSYIFKVLLVFISAALMWYKTPILFKKTVLKSILERVSTINMFAKKRGIKYNENERKEV